MFPVDMLSNLRYALLALVLLAATASTSAAGLDDHPELQPTDVHEHDRCLVCDGELDKNGLAFLYKGRRITLDTLHLEAFLQTPGAYLAQLQPRGALFQESGGGYLSKGWLFAGIWMLLGLVGAAVCTGIALRKGLPPMGWFAAGLATNILAVIVIFTRPASESIPLPPRLAKIPVTADPYLCTRCGAQNHPSARHCIGCDAVIDSTADSEVERAGLRSRS